VKSYYPVAEPHMPLEVPKNSNIFFSPKNFKKIKNKKKIPRMLLCMVNFNNAET
jgi:hypothetical protein